MITLARLRMDRAQRYFDRLREPWRFLLFIGIAGPLVCLDTAVTWGLVTLLVLWRGWWIFLQEKR